VRSNITYSLVTVGIGLALMLVTPWVLKESKSMDNEKMTLNSPTPTIKGESTPFNYNLAADPQPNDMIAKNIEYLKDVTTGGLEKWNGQEVISKDIVYQEDDTYAIRTVFKTTDNKKLLLIEMFSQDLNPIAEKAYRAEVLEIDVLPSHFPNPPQYPPNAKKEIPRSKSDRDLRRLSLILDKSVAIVPTGNPMTGGSEDLREGYRILVPAPNTPQEIFDLYDKIENIAGTSGVVRLQKP